MKHNSCPASHSRVINLFHGKRSPGLGRPNVALILVILGRNLNLISDQVRGVEAHAELPNHANVSPGREGLHEGLGSGFGDGSEIVDEVGLGHSDSRVLDGQRVVGLVGDELDLELGLGIEDGAVRERLVADFVEGIGRVGDELAEEDFLVGVESVDDQREELVDVSGEGVAFGVGAHGEIVWVC